MCTKVIQSYIWGCKRFMPVGATACKAVVEALAGWKLCAQ